jgi:hypothetical protein
MELFFKARIIEIGLKGSWFFNGQQLFLTLSTIFEKKLLLKISQKKAQK